MQTFSCHQANYSHGLKPIERADLLALVEDAYIDYFNDFLTVERFAEHYGITEDEAHHVIALGRLLNHRLRG